MKTQKNIVLVDDHVVVRTGLKELIQKLGTYQVCAEFDDGESLLKNFPFETPVDLIILDLSLPCMNGDAVMRELNKKGNQIPVLILTLNSDEAVIIRLFRLGVRGYLQKNCTSAELKKAIEEIFTSGYYHNEFLTMSLQCDSDTRNKTEQEKLLDRLSERELEFLKLVCSEADYTYEQVADRMNVQRRTVDGYREGVFEKLGVKSKTGLVVFVLKNKLYDLLQTL